jgi:signal transduction histidine kinase
MVDLAGWLAAACATCVALLAWRLLGTRTEAVARACHELRGPITAARLGLQLGVRSGELTPDRLRALDQELGRAGLALEDLSTVQVRPSRSARARPRCVAEQVDLSEVVRASIEAWRPWAASRGSELRTASLADRAYVRGDRLRIAQATGNLIANAIEHGGGRIELSCVARAGTARIRVADDGPGLPAPVSELCRRARHGRGLRGRGLAIVSDVAQAHGGRLSAEATERGTQLVLELPTLRD